LGKIGRKLYSKKIKAKILIEQMGRCAYCNASLHERPIQWDHFIPWIYLESSGGKENWVASCPGCNGRKHARIFQDEDSIAEFCVGVIQKHGALGEGWPEGTEIWQRKLHVEASDTPDSGYSLLPEGFGDED